MTPGHSTCTGARRDSTDRCGSFTAARTSSFRRRYALRYQSVYGTNADVTIVPEGDHMWSTVAVREQLIARTVDFVTRQVASASQAASSGRHGEHSWS